MEQILKWETFNNIKIKTSLHQSLNPSKGVVKSSELSLCTLDEIKTNLKNQNVADIKRITIKKNGETINANPYILNFNTPKPPTEINVGYMKINVKTYILNPLRCFKCQRFRHHQDRGTRPPVCGRCGKNNTRHMDCQKEAFCTNCRKKSPCKFQRLWSLEKGKRYHQNKIHKKHYIPRGKENDRSSEIFKNVKKKHSKHKPTRTPNMKITKPK